MLEREQRLCPPQRRGRLGCSLPFDLCPAAQSGSAQIFAKETLLPESCRGLRRLHPFASIRGVPAPAMSSSLVVRAVTGPVWCRRNVDVLQLCSRCLLRPFCCFPAGVGAEETSSVSVCLKKPSDRCQRVRQDVSGLALAAGALASVLSSDLGKGWVPRRPPPGGDLQTAPGFLTSTPSASQRATAPGPAIEEMCCLPEARSPGCSELASSPAQASCSFPWCTYISVSRTGRGPGCPGCFAM